MEPILEATSLTKIFGAFRAVDGISFHIRKAECFGILGPNGAGKTSTIRMLYGFSPKSDGHLRIFGLDADRDLRRIKARIGVCQQENTLDPDLSVEQNLEVFARYFDLPRRGVRERAAELLRFIALDHRRQAKIPELSGGMLRRLMLARALINDPEMLILDEPTTGLDPQSRHQVWLRLEELKSRGLSILLTTHYMDEATRLCDRLVILDHGRILVEGAPLDLIRQHVGREVIEVSSPPESLRRFVQEQKLKHEDLGHRLIIYSSNGEPIYHRIKADHWPTGCILRLATLEDVFLRLTGRELRE
ncbi:MAG: ATP-binding cassette domain-containing protein [Desulfuromonadales bacterium]